MRVSAITKFKQDHKKKPKAATIKKCVANYRLALEEWVAIKSPGAIDPPRKLTK